MITFIDFCYIINIYFYYLVCLMSANKAYKILPNLYFCYNITDETPLMEQSVSHLILTDKAMQKEDYDLVSFFLV